MQNNRSKKNQLKVYPKNIPDQLKRIDNWIGWKPEKRNGDLTKVPYDPSTGEHASSTDPETWVDFDTLKKNPEYRLGFVLTESPFAGVDLDDCRDPDTGELADEAQRIVDRLDSYTEVSPSGTGLHIIVEGSFTEGGNKTGDVDGFGELEMYRTARYFTVTGDVLDGEKSTIEPRHEELEELHTETFGEQTGGSKSLSELDDPDLHVGLSDDEVLQKAKEAENGDKFKRLWEGDSSLWEDDEARYTSHSEPDLALVSLLTFWTGPNPEQIDRLFRKSGLVRDKWIEREGYRAKTIGKALKNRNKDDYYEKPHKKPPREPHSQPPEKSKGGSGGEEDEGTIHEKLLAIAEEATLFRTADNRMFAEVEEDGTPYVYEIKQKGAGGNNFRNWLIRKYNEKYGKGPNSASISRTMEVARAECATAEERDIYKRIADLDDKILIDLAGSQHRAVEVTPEGYEITDSPQINFWRPDGVRSLPEPEGTISDIKYLQELLNVGNEDFSLLVAWILATFQTAGSYPVLIPTGPSGSAKSTLTKLIRNLLDPAGETGRVTTRSIQQSEDLFSVARHRHLLAFDNQSRLKQWQSDALSAIATGGGIEKRQLYTDDNLVTIDTMNPIIMNGIDISGIGNDLLDRAIFLHLEEPTERVRDKEIWEKFDEYHSRIFGGLCDALTKTLERRSWVEVTQEEMTRMADFSQWLKSAEPAIQQIEGLEDINPTDIYHGNRQNAGRDALQESDLGSILIDFLELQEPDKDGVLWEGNSSELLNDLEHNASVKVVESKYWPTSPVSLGKRLKRMVTTLSKVGIGHDKRTTNQGRIHRFFNES